MKEARRISPAGKRRPFPNGGRGAAVFVPWSLLLGIGFALAGCGAGRLELEAAADRVNRADQFLETVRSLNLPSAYPDLTASAEASLAEARTALAAEEVEAARRAADASGQASREALRRYHRETVARLAERAKAVLAGRDPEDPLTREIPEMDRIIGRAVAGEGAAESAAPLEAVGRVLGDLETVLAVSGGLRQSWRHTFAVDEGFRPGTDELSDAGLETLDALAGEIRTGMAPAAAGEPPSVRGWAVKVVGYTDGINFGRGTPLVARLTRGVESETPETDPARRRFLNQRLSRFRASAVAEALAERLKAWADGPVAVEAAGRGEEIPAEVPPPHPAADPRRRICRIFVHAVAR
jgi:outer membrane protein OmpA-like peptidoglycan-associated protein